MIRDRLVCGVNDDRIQRRLLSETGTLNLKREMESALSIEKATRDVFAPSGIRVDRKKPDKYDM